MRRETDPPSIRNHRQFLYNFGTNPKQLYSNACVGAHPVGVLIHRPESYPDDAEYSKRQFWFLMPAPVHGIVNIGQSLHNMVQEYYKYWKSPIPKVFPFEPLTMSCYFAELQQRTFCLFDILQALLRNCADGNSETVLRVLKISHKSLGALIPALSRHWDKFEFDFQTYLFHTHHEIQVSTMTDIVDITHALVQVVIPSLYPMYRYLVYELRFSPFPNLGDPVVYFHKRQLERIKRNFASRILGHMFAARSVNYWNTMQLYLRRNRTREQMHRTRSHD